jgi:2Fe-2S ferredoxin
MAKVIYKNTDGRSKEVNVEEGLSIMEGALKYNIAGIDADCGGACACATCHVYVDEAWVDEVGARTETEEAMLDFAEDVRENSRLSCQIRVTKALDGVVVTTARA